MRSGVIKHLTSIIASVLKSEISTVKIVQRTLTVLQ